MTDYILAIDQGTTSSRALLFDDQMQLVGSAQQEFKQYFPQSGWVEHDPDDLLSSTIQTCKQAIQKYDIKPHHIKAIGITNQRETTLIWDRHTGKPIHRALVWQDRRTADLCAKLKQAGHEQMISAKTGLVLDPYFSATKLCWLLDHVDGARGKAKQGDLLFGTVDSYLIWQLTGGQNHVTDATNAARTMLYDIHQGAWSAEICDLLDIPISMLPKVQDCASHFGVCADHILGAPIPILGVAGDQQAATLGQGCFDAGMMKSTYGTGCFALMNTGDTPVTSHNKMLTTIAYQLNGKPTYALEGSIFMAGAVVQWLRDSMNFIQSAHEVNDLAATADIDQMIYLVPAFTGLGAPYWNPHCRGAIYGLARNSGQAEIAAAALDSIAFQTRDLLEAMHDDIKRSNAVNSAAEESHQQIQHVLRVDGGMSASDHTMQAISNLIGAQVDRPQILETTALGAAWLAGMQAGLYPDQAEFQARWKAETRFEPKQTKAWRDTRYKGWRQAVAATIHYSDMN
ncbi:MAG: glycerol kinase GlpK [Alphaproteobacteria bacterium]